ncbi:putative adenosinetriphosphatase [Rosellinia necatrix]|uniref:Putative adenosinetriphosphatase n=1 Tax=Rosellinia necatrix TaxID=77044 RepID=A0A1W2THK7_ROSNE|nr:putative adenosinetriphosphatase [Rosellinia necatrix]
MAPQTRRSTGAAKALAAAAALDELEAAEQRRGAAQESIDRPKRGRGRPSKNQASVTATGSGESTSSALTPLTNPSDGEYSTPATSYVVTPVPPHNSTRDAPAPTNTTNRPRRNRIIVELPELSDGDNDDNQTIQKSKPFKSTAVIRTKRQRPTSFSYNEDSDEEADLYGNDQLASIALARRLEREEEQNVSVANLSIPTKRSARTVLLAPDSESDLITDRPSKAKQKHISSSARFAEPDSRLAGRSHGAQAHQPPRKRQKISTNETTASQSSALNTDMEDDAESLNSFYSVENSSSNISEYSSSGSGDADEHNAPVAPPLPSTPASSPRAARAQALRARASRRALQYSTQISKRLRMERFKLEEQHPELNTMWEDLKNMPALNAGTAMQPTRISLQLKSFQLQGLAWMKAMEQTPWKGGLLGDEMGLGKTIQAVSLIMSDYPAKMPSLVLLPPVALGQWQDEIATYTGNALKTIVFHGTNAKVKNLSVKELKKFDVIIMSYNSLESLYRKQEKGIERKDGRYFEKSIIHQIKFHRVILDEAHCIKTRTTMTARACFALKVTYRWCLTGTPLQNRIGEFFSLIRFLEITPYASYFCKECPCSSLEWSMGDTGRCTKCSHFSIRHVSVFNQELLNPIQKYGNTGIGKEAFQKLRLLTNRIMLRRLKKDHTNVMELPVKEIYVDRQFFCEEENDFASSIMTNTERQFNTYVAQGVLLNNYANIFTLLMRMRQVADHPDLILKKSGEGGQNILVCCICDEPAEEAIRSRCKHDFCRQCATSYLASQDEPDCPQCHIPLSIDLEQPSMEQDELLMKKSSIINRIKMENWTSSSKIELLVHELHKLRSDNASHKSIIFSQFTTMLQLIEWRLRRAGITTVMLDGTMTPAQRQASIKHFMEKPEVECFLVSLKAGGVALNLTEASRVFIVDPWWNPAAEWQSADRCHRIGQTRPCTITRLCIEDSVESRMVLLQEKKTHMIHSTINSDDAAMESLTPNDLMFLFRGS